MYKRRIFWFVQKYKKKLVILLSIGIIVIKSKGSPIPADILVGI